MESYERKSKREFRLLAAFYELFDLASSLNSGLNPGQVLAATVPEEAPRILEVCTGTTSSAIAVAGTHLRSEIVGVDLSPEMIAIAEGKNRRSKTKGNHTWSR